MTEAVVATAAPAAASPEPAYVERRLGAGFWVSIVWVGLVIAAAVLAGLLPLQDPTAIGHNAPRLGPTAGHLLGTDELGRDLLARVVYGARTSLIVGFASIAFGIVVGGALGLVAGYYGGRLDAAINGLSTVLLAFPALIFLLTVVTFLGQNLFDVTLTLGVLSVAPIARIIRANTLVYANREFVLAARALGARNRRILVREILPNVLPSALAFSLVAVAVVIVAEGALSFLGLSVRPPTPTWGGMIAEGGQVLAQDALVALWPSLAMFATVLALNFAGDKLQSYFQVREGGL
ncbi:MAG TPA: ABC transporter permease [Candidatus Dormibacteraeota bacterium]|nr:ABC transporter permease [Candidatus Dormibacteraeota bacterium]